VMAWRARTEDCLELCERRVRIELELTGASVDFEKCIRICVPASRKWK
jgi:hypothetical protein